MTENASKVLLVKRLFFFASLLILLSACSGIEKRDQDTGPTRPVDWANVEPVSVKKEPKSRYGNPDTYEVYGITYRILDSARNFKQKGVASWYGTKFHGRRTSSGEPYDMLKLTAAHKTLPIPCYVKVTNKDNGRVLIVRVNDRGPFVKSRIIDLSYAAAHKLGMADKGIANVEIETINVDVPIAKKLKRSSKKISQKVRKKPLKNATNKPKNNSERFVQVGAYSKHQSAQKLAKVLDREINLPVTISSILRLGKTLYRVRIGPVKSLAIAEELSDILNIKELGKPRIVYED